MIPIERYDKDTEEKYWKCVSKIMKYPEQIEIVTSCRKYMPSDFFPQNASLKELVLAPYEKIKKAHKYIEKDKSHMEVECSCYINGKKEMTPLYKRLYGRYETVSQKIIDGMKMSIFLVEQTGLTVCPYCNRDYINCRSERLTGAQLDHFYPRSEYPIFSVCLYNLVPVCGNCNRIKSSAIQEFASPFDEGIDWENALRFSYEPLDINRKKITIDAEEPVRQNIKAMHIEKAYQIHEMEVNELLDKVSMYPKTQLEEFKQVLGKLELTEQDMKKMVFGPEITKESMKKKPLGRMMRDLERELGIYV